MGDIGPDRDLNPDEAFAVFKDSMPKRWGSLNDAVPEPSPPPKKITADKA